MVYPRISGLLNNCALNSALPTLLEGIRQLADREASETLGNLVDNSIFKSYQQIKNLFASYYSLENHPGFNWREFHRFLSSHSFYANEILFAPVFRGFIAENGFNSGEYQRQDLGLLRDVQDDGRYTLLPINEAIALFHNPLGITVRTHEFNENRETTEPLYHLADTRQTTHQDYPFGDAPTLEIYLKNHHFEIQPHEALAEANESYVEEINALPQALLEIHDGLSISQHAHSSNQNLGRLAVYGHKALMQQIINSSTPFADDDTPPASDVEDVSPAKDDPTLSADDDISPASDIEDTSPAEDDPTSPSDAPTDKPETKKTLDDIEKKHKEYLISAETYAITGRAFHSDTSAGRQTFAAILLAMLLENKDKKAPVISAHLDNLAIAINGNEPLASYHLDKLAKAIIDSKADLTAKLVTDVVEEIEVDHQAKTNMLAMSMDDQDENQIHLVNLAKDAIKKAWQLYQETNDEHLIKVINQTRLIATDPTSRNIRTYNELREKVEGKGSWGRVLAGIMLAVIGAALVVAAVVGAVITAPLTPVLLTASVGVGALGAASIAAGVCFFNSGRDKGLYKQMGEVSEKAKLQLPQALR